MSPNFTDLTLVSREEKHIFFYFEIYTLIVLQSQHNVVHPAPLPLQFLPHSTHAINKILRAKNISLKDLSSLSDYVSLQQNLFHASKIQIKQF